MRFRGRGLDLTYQNRRPMRGTLDMFDVGVWRRKCRYGSWVGNKEKESVDTVALSLEDDELLSRFGDVRHFVSDF